MRGLADVRRFPGSRRWPHFGAEPLAAALGAAGIGYRHEPDLGGRRAPRPDSSHTGWRNAGFRGYADWMEGEAFRAALARVEAWSAERTVALMCAEAVPWRCHRRLIADALVARGHEVRDIYDAARAEPHALTPFATVLPGGALRYGPRPGPARDASSRS